MLYRGLDEIADELYGPPRVPAVFVGEVDGFGRMRRLHGSLVCSFDEQRETDNERDGTDSDKHPSSRSGRAGMQQRLTAPLHA